MCTTSQAMDPTGMMKKHNKLLDPLGLTHTAIGDPTGRWRRSYKADTNAALSQKITQNQQAAFALAKSGNGNVQRSY